MTPEVTGLLEKARRSLEAAEKLQADGHYDFAASRAYYAMFYTAEALLLSRDLSYSRHGQVIAAFGRHFVRTGIFDREHHRALRTAYDRRSIADYEYSASFPESAALQTLRDAAAFVEAGIQFLDQD